MGAKINYTTIISFISVSVCLSALGLITWGAFHFSNRGFELSDETYYLYFSNNFSPDIYLTTAFGILNKFFCFGSPTLINLRLAKFIYQSLAVIIFAFSLFRHLKFKKVKLEPVAKLLILSVLLLCSYVNYDYLPMTMSYNTWSLILALLGMAVIFHEKTKTEVRAFFGSSLLFGIICFALFLAKFPNAFILFFVYVLVNVKNTKAELFIKTIGLLSGAVLGFIVFLHSFESLKGIFNNYWLTIFDVKHAPVHPYSAQLKSFMLMCWEKNYLAAEIALIFLAILMKRINFNFKTSIFYFLLLLNYTLMFLFRNGNGFELYNDFMAGSIVLINIGLYVYMFGTQKTGWSSILWWCLMLMPVGLMLGTNNEFYYTVSQLMIFAVAGMLLLFASGANNLNFLSITGAVISVFVVCVLYSGAVKHPYRQSDLTAKAIPLSFSKEIDGILESKERITDYLVLNEALKKINTSDKPVLQFFNHFGIHYLNGCPIFPEPQITDNERLMYINQYLFRRYGLPNNCDVLLMPKKASENSAFQYMFIKNGVVLNGNFKKVFSYKFLCTGEEILIYKRI